MPSKLFFQHGFSVVFSRRTLLLLLCILAFLFSFISFRIVDFYIFVCFTSLI